MSSIFDTLSKPLQRLLSKSGFAEPTIPQTKTIPIILSGRNVLLIAPTGTGKTEAAFLPILQMLLSQPRSMGIKIVYVSPLRALNRDLLDRLEWWCKRLDFRISVRHGDTEVRERRKQALSPPDILVTTPETLQILLNGRRFSQHLATTQWVIVDEVHELVDNKRGTQLSLSLERLRWISGKDFQIVGLSATIGSPKEVAQFLVGVGRSCEVVDVSVVRETQLDVIHPIPTRQDHRLATQLYTFPEVAARLRAMRDLIERHGSTLLFTNTRPMAEILASRFRIWDMDFPVSIHHGSLSSYSRVRTEEGLKRGELKGVICVSGDSRVLLSDGQWKPIEKLAACNGPLIISSLSKSHKIRSAIARLVRKTGMSQLIQITTKTGFSLKCTPDHGLLTVDKHGELKWLLARDLCPGLPVAIAGYLQNKQIPIKEKSNSDIFWDNICDTKEINEEEPVYDVFDVNPTSNFIVNGFITHNCTSSLELGIDVGSVDLCIQYNSPRQVTRLLQRAGRSGHQVGGLAKGVVVVQDPDDALESIVIVGRAYRSELESVSIPEKPLDVLMHELAGMMVYQRRWKISEAHEIAKRAYPFRDLTREDVEAVLSYMEGFIQKLAWFSREEDVFSRPMRYKRLFKYYFDNLSMIPYVKQYLVINEAKNLPVGTLDESFIAQYGNPGVKFIMGGSVWKIIQIFRDGVYVKSDTDAVGAIPSWVGEEIPVPYSVAQEVGKIRRRVEEGVRESHSLYRISEALAEEFQVDGRVVKDAIGDSYEQARVGIPLPCDERITVEKWKDLIIVHTHYGTLINRTLSRYIGSWISETLGETLSVFDDPYRVFLRSKHLSSEEVVDVFKSGITEDFNRVVKDTILQDRYFRWRLVQVARRMGSLVKEAELDSSVVDQLVKGLRGTIVYEEAFKEVIFKDLDLRGTIGVLKRMAEGEIELVSLGDREEPSPIMKTCLRWRSIRLEPVSPKRLRVLAIASAKARILSEVRTFICVDCQRMIEEKRIHDLEDRPKCSYCGSTSIGMVEDRPQEIYRILEMLDRLPKRSKGFKTWRKVMETSKLISRFGKPAAVALALDAITLEKAADILERERRLTGRFFELVMEAEKRSIIRRISARRST
ncbi:MAG: DEAD/DEAH box helicase [Nitrososphaeria archaeon]|nr:DEAD/DEAH box helicase [Nitrososphaeria archaeon]NIN52210.1 DEAD/DEAH box helicase [Nitrososphaeria archaeon]NIQ32663.1 DEAD/DEAH box helicase [Nitrososphaeria archaeon]